MTVGEYLLSISSLPSGNTAVAHLQSEKRVIARAFFNILTQKQTINKKVETNFNIETTKDYKINNENTNIKVEQNESFNISW